MAPMQIQTNSSMGCPHCEKNGSSSRCEEMALARIMERAAAANKTGFATNKQAMHVQTILYKLSLCCSFESSSSMFKNALRAFLLCGPRLSIEKGRWLQFNQLGKMEQEGEEDKKCELCLKKQWTIVKCTNLIGLYCGLLWGMCMGVEYSSWPTFGLELLKAWILVFGVLYFGTSLLSIFEFCTVFKTFGKKRHFADAFKNGAVAPFLSGERGLHGHSSLMA